jgi:hypothetical protein
LFFCAYQGLFVESIYRFVIFRFIELRLVHMCDRYYRRSDKQRVGEAFNLGSLPPDLIFPDWNDNFAPNTFQPVIRNARETRERELVLMYWRIVPFLLGEVSHQFNNPTGTKTRAGQMNGPEDQLLPDGSPNLPDQYTGSVGHGLPLLVQA